MSVTIKEPQAAQDQLLTPDLDATEFYSWTIRLFQRHGTCWLGWSGRAPFRAQRGRVNLYKDEFPWDPDKFIQSTWDNIGTEFDTKLPWGSGYCAARVAERANGKAVYIVKTDVTA